MRMPEMRDTSEFKIRKKEFLKLTPGNHIVRILPDEQGFHLTYTHWLNRANIECLEDDCPICVNNRRIIAENPKTFRNIKSYSSKRQVFYVNILDRTPSKVCPNCAEANKSVTGEFPTVCQNCSAVIVNVEPTPRNKVCILNRGKEFYSNIKSVNGAITDELGEPVGIESYDLMIMVPADTKRPVAQGLPHQNDEIEYDEKEIYQLDEAPLRMDGDEIKSFLSGVSLSDIYSARNAEENDDIPTEIKENFEFDLDKIEEVPFDVDKTPKETPVETDEDIAESVKNLFKDL